MKNSGWRQAFDDPVILPGGKHLATLQDAANFIMKLPKADQAATQWQTATECLIGTAEGRDFNMHARIGMLRAINHGRPEPERSLARSAPRSIVFPE